MADFQICISVPLRKITEFKRSNVKTVYSGTETLTFLGPRIWEIVPDYIKKSNSFEDSKFKIKLWSLENCPCMLCKRLSCFFITYLLIFMQHFSSYLSHIFILSILNRFCLFL